MPQIQVNQESVGLRLDKFLCQKFDISFGLAQKLIREKKVKVNNKRVDATYKTQDSDCIEIFSDLNLRTNFVKQKPKISAEKIKNFLSKIIYEDKNLVAIDKPSGLATQGGSAIDISVDDLLNYIPNCQSPQLVHRLDKDTSGILLIAKNKDAAEFLTQAFKNKLIEKVYLALVCGVIKKPSGTIKIPLRKKFVGKNEKVYPDFEEGKEAITNYQILKTFYDSSLLQLNPVTGRTHQLRVHCKEIGFPIINDVKYGGTKVARKEVSNRLCLHAYRIKIKDYFGEELIIESDVPDFFRITKSCLQNKNK